MSGPFCRNTSTNIQKINAKAAEMENYSLEKSIFVMVFVADISFPEEFELEHILDTLIFIYIVY